MLHVNVKHEVVHGMQEGVVDECGVCGGLVTTCAIAVVTQLQITPSTKRFNQTLQVPSAST